MSGKRSAADPIEGEIELALDPGSYIGSRNDFGFLDGLGKVAARVESVARFDPARAVALLETFLAGCYEKADEVDDSGGSFGMFVEDLHCAWIRTRQLAGADADETAARVLAWMDDDQDGCPRSRGPRAQARLHSGVRGARRPPRPERAAVVPGAGQRRLGEASNTGSMT